MLHSLAPDSAAHSVAECCKIKQTNSRGINIIIICDVTNTQMTEIFNSY